MAGPVAVNRPDTSGAVVVSPPLQEGSPGENLERESPQRACLTGSHVCRGAPLTLKAKAGRRDPGPPQCLIPGGITHVDGAAQSCTDTGSCHMDWLCVLPLALPIPVI